MAWLDLGWLQVVWFVVAVYAVTAAVVHICLRRLLRRRDVAQAQARGELSEVPVLSWAGRARRLMLQRAAVLRGGYDRMRRQAALGAAPEVVVLPRPHVQVPQIAARPAKPAPRVGLSDGVPTMAITLVPRQRVVDLTQAERLPAPEDDGPVRWWHAARS